jgi:hypothetical protein
MLLTYLFSDLCLSIKTKTNPHALKVGDYSTSVGFLGFSYRTNELSASDKIDELSTLITAGRLSAENKQVMLVSFKRLVCPTQVITPIPSSITCTSLSRLQDAHAYFLTNNGTDFADNILLKLMSAAPEFHTSNTGEIKWVETTNVSNLSGILTFICHVTHKCVNRDHRERSHHPRLSHLRLTKPLSTLA